MTTQADILAALHTLCRAAAPGVDDVKGFNGDAVKPERITGRGVIIGSTGDPGEPEYELSPLSYTYNHVIPVDIAFPTFADGAELGDAPQRAVLASIGAAVLADRTLGGLVTFLDVTAPIFTTDDFTGAVAVRTATFVFVAEYTVSNPLAA